MSWMRWTVFLGVVVVTGCSGAGEVVDAGHDGGVGELDAGHDAGVLPPCHCSVADGVLTLSWDCYCAAYGCEYSPPVACEAFRTNELACGLRVDTVVTAGGPAINVYDSAGVFIGTQTGSDLGDYVCPDDSSLHALTRRAGVVPDAACAKTTCDCASGNVNCGAAPDAGSLPPCGCTVDNGVLTMSMECFCATRDCSDVPALTCPGYRQSSLACGLRLDTSNPPGGPIISAFDDAGVLVGVQRSSDTLSFVCPDNSALKATLLRAGVLPDAGCPEVACGCVDGGVACP